MSINEEILINITPRETRVAIVENGTLQEVSIERQTSRGIVGNIYKGKVNRVLPGMEAAFVDIGLDKAGTYRKLELTFDRTYTSYRAWIGDTDGADLNLAILDKGVCANIVDDGELAIFVPANGQLNRVQDKQIATDMALTNWGDRVVYIRDGEVWGVRMT